MGYKYFSFKADQGGNASTAHIHLFSPSPSVSTQNLSFIYYTAYNLFLLPFYILPQGGTKVLLFLFSDFLAVLAK